MGIHLSMVKPIPMRDLCEMRLSQTDPVHVTFSFTPTFIHYINASKGGIGAHIKRTLTLCGLRMDRWKSRAIRHCERYLALATAPLSALSRRRCRSEVSRRETKSLEFIFTVPIQGDRADLLQSLWQVVSACQTCHGIRIPVQIRR